MRLSACLLVLALAGMVAGAALIGRWAIGCAIMADSVFVAWWALHRDDGADDEPQPSAHSVERVLDRARAAS
jgi:hypothetical protein